jgi:hypothetical protein
MVADERAAITADRAEIILAESDDESGRDENSHERPIPREG